MLIGPGCWLTCVDGWSGAPGQPALFVDRDDLLVRDPGFLHRPGDVALVAGAALLVRAANRAGWPVILVTNQSGIARGLFGWDDFQAVNDRMERLLSDENAYLNAMLACAWHPDGIAPLRGAHPWRKPRAGMIHAAAVRFGIALDRSWLAGDRMTDMRAARDGGLAGGLLLRPAAAGLRSRAVARFSLVSAPSLALCTAWAQAHLWRCARQERAA